MAIALIVAAGSGERLGARRPKALVELAGRPLLQWSVDALAGLGAIERLVVALPATLDGLPEGVSAPPGSIAAAGGATRSESVKRALAAAGPGDPVLVHDAARPLLSASLAEEVLGALDQTGADAAIAATAVTDTIKRAAEGGRAGRPLVAETLRRGELWAVQTPQVFRRAVLERALDVAPEVLAQATDDAWLVERCGGSVAIVAAGPENLKVTTRLDLQLAELLLAERDPAGA
ncbi:MAG: 2-C-methyl-D-erythritol 4-phosphate cytidylyltransferase [Acidobacteriota bacterium]|nr:2-C-methyl-D-erythritol 4-phosphate cytidylyltransferase [Acidobacteriota bacterium]